MSGLTIEAIQLKGGREEDILRNTLEEREPAVATDTGKLFIGGADGTPVEVLGGTGGGNGANGKSAYDIALEKGFAGSEAEWLESLKGERGEDGGNGKSAYELALEKGFAGSEAEWLESLKGEKGADGKAATIKIGEVMTGEPGTDVIITNSGTENNAVFDFTIPHGESGIKGTCGNIGEIFWWPLTTPPQDSLYCNGSEISRTDYKSLFEVIGTQFGAGDGSTTFNLPDLQGEFIRGYDPNNKRDPDGGTRNIGKHQSSTALNEAITDCWQLGVSDYDGTFTTTQRRAALQSTAQEQRVTYRIRPTNVNLLPCIRYKEHTSLNTNDLYKQWKKQETERADITFDE